MIDLDELDDIKDPMIRVMVKLAVLMFLVELDTRIDGFLNTFKPVCLPIGGSPPGADGDKV